MENSSETVTSAIDFLKLAVGIFGGVFAGLIVAFIVTVTLRAISYNKEILRLTVVKARTAAYIFSAFLGAMTGFEYATYTLDAHKPRWVETADHVLLICLILSATWICMRLVSVVEDIVYHYSNSHNAGRGMRFATQAQIMSRVGQAIVFACGIAGVVLTFPQARLITGSLLASAGVVSIVAGMAAQSSLSNMFAGLQIAISDSLRVGDIVVVVNNGISTQVTVEEITLTYVVVRIWDDRRIIIPSIKFTQNSFENWTRRAASLMGTIEMQLDWSAPVNAFRRHVEKLLNSTDLWDARSYNVQVTDSNENKMTLRVSVSAKNAGDLWDLKCYLRENLITWIREEHPDAIPKLRLSIENNQNINNHNSPQQRVSSQTNIITAKENEKIEKFPVDTLEKNKRIKTQIKETKETPKNDSSKNKDDNKTSKEKNKKKIRRKSINAKREKARIAHLHDMEQTQVLSDEEIENQFIAMSQLNKDIKSELEDDTETSLAVERLYSGSPENEERAKIFDGPGADVIEEREKTAMMNLQDIHDSENNNEQNNNKAEKDEKDNTKFEKNKNNVKDENLDIPSIATTQNIQIVTENSNTTEDTTTINMPESENTSNKKSPTPQENKQENINKQPQKEENR